MIQSSRTAVRLATPDDTIAVERLVHDAFLPYLPRIGRPPAPMTADYRQAITAGSVWVLDIDGQLGGILVLTQHTDHLLIDNIAVDPQHQGAGVGAQLLQHAEQEAQTLGLTELRLYTNERMTENLSYYPRRGYRETGRHTQDGYARVFFSKQLPGRTEPIPNPDVAVSSHHGGATTSWHSPRCGIRPKT